MNTNTTENTTKHARFAVDYPAVLKNSSTGIATIDSQYQIIECNLSFQELTKISTIPTETGNLLSIINFTDEEKNELHTTLKCGEPWEGVVIQGEKALRVELNLNPHKDPLTQESQPHPYGIVFLINYTDELHKIQELSEEKVEAERTNKAKSDFLSHMSHELRTPLNAILGFTQLLETSVLDEEQLDNLSEINSAGKHLLSMLEEILDLSKIESGSIQLCNEFIELEQIIEESCSLMKPLLKKHQVTLDFTVQENLRFSTDSVRLKQVILNLLTNAVKYNHQGGHVRLHSFLNTNKRLIIEIQDTGQGISDQAMESIFNPFERLNVGRDIEGTGIGLMITRQLLNMLNGEIHAFSSPGYGSVFWIELPLPISNNENHHENEMLSLLWLGADDRKSYVVKKLATLRPNTTFHITSEIEEVQKVVNDAQNIIVFSDKLKVSELTHSKAKKLLKPNDRFVDIQDIVCHKMNSDSGKSGNRHDDFKFGLNILSILGFIDQ